jgi:transposase InsO family protein
VADITYIKVGEYCQYLITIVDVFSRQILGCSLSKNRTVEDVLPVLRRVTARRRPLPGLIFHTDRGIEYMVYTIQDELEKHDLLKS